MVIRIVQHEYDPPDEHLEMDYIRKYLFEKLFGQDCPKSKSRYDDYWKKVEASYLLKNYEENLPLSLQWILPIIVRPR